MDFDATGQLLIMYSAIIKYLQKKKKWECSETMHQLFIDCKKACDLEWRYCILFSMNLVSL